MRQPSDAETDEPTLDDLLWELDVTTTRTERRADARRSASPRSSASPVPPKASKRGRFHRPELESPWERIAGNRVVQTVSGVVLVGGTATLVVLALGR